MDTITISSTGPAGRRRHRISGLTDGDMRLLANAISEGSYRGGDSGGPVSEALLRFENALRVPVRHPNERRVDIVGGTSDAARLYEEIGNLR